MSNLCKKNIPGPLADSFCNDLVKELDNFRNSNSLPQCQGNKSFTNGDGVNDWENKIFQSTRIISTIKESEFVTDVLLNHVKDENKQVVISVACQGVSLGIHGTATLIVIGTTQGEAFIFDILKCSEMVNDGGLKSILEHEKIIKIIHDCRHDKENLQRQFRVQLQNVFDTQVAHSVIHNQRSNSYCYRKKLNVLLEIYKAPINPVKDKMKKIYQINPNYWTKRPLTSEMVLFAASNVLVLINKQLYNNMASLINVSSLPS